MVSPQTDKWAIIKIITMAFAQQWPRAWFARENQPSENTVHGYFNWLKALSDYKEHWCTKVPGFQMRSFTSPSTQELCVRCQGLDPQVKHVFYHWAVTLSLKQRCAFSLPMLWYRINITLLLSYMISPLAPFKHCRSWPLIADSWKSQPPSQGNSHTLTSQVPRCQGNQPSHLASPVAWWRHTVSDSGIKMCSFLFFFLQKCN